MKFGERGECLALYHGEIGEHGECLALYRGKIGEHGECLALYHGKIGEHGECLALKPWRKWRDNPMKIGPTIQYALRPIEP